MPRLTAAAFCAGARPGKRWRKGDTRDQLPGMAASIATIAPLASPVSASTKARTRLAAASPLAASGASASQRAGAVAADRQAQREAAAGFVAVGAAERRAIIGLGVRLAAEQIVSEAAVAADGRERRAELLGAREIRQGRLRLAIGDRDRAHSGLRQRALAG